MQWLFILNTHEQCSSKIYWQLVVTILAPQLHCCLFETFCLYILCKLICNVCCNIGWVLVWYWIMPGLFCNQIFDTLFLRFCWFLLDFYKLNTDIWYMLILLVRPHSNNWTVPSWNIWLIDSFLVTSFYFGMPFPHETICLIYAFLVC